MLKTSSPNIIEPQSIMGLMPKQFNFELTEPQTEMFLMEYNRVPYPLFIGGYGCGKSHILVWNAVRDVLAFPGAKVGVYCPTHDLLSLNLVPRFEELFADLGIGTNLQKQAHILDVGGAGNQLIFRSMDNPGRIVAYEVYRSHVDEADLLNTAEKGEEVWNRILARNRQNHPYKEKIPGIQFNMVSAYSTPESYKFTYRRWGKDPAEGYKYVRAPTSSNWNLDESFVKNLQNSYTPEQCKAYLEGFWTNIFTGNVYSYFNREKHHSDRIITDSDTLHISVDFNYGGCCCAVYVKENKLIKQKDNDGELTGKVTKTNLKYPTLVEEFAPMDTEEIVLVTEEKYPHHKVLFYPDSTGKANSTNASLSDIAILKKAGYGVIAKKKNPRINDRINAVQRLLYNDLFHINTSNCPETTSSLEQHAYSPNTGLPEKFGGAATVDDRNDGMGYLIAHDYPIRGDKMSVASLGGL